ncbi:hypothetical protein D3C80_1499690 [compost metagenome]
MAGECRRCCIGGHVEFSLRDRARHDRHQKVRPDDAGQHVDLVALNHLVGDLDGKLRLLRVVLGDDGDVLVAGLLDRQHEAVAGIDAEACTATRKRGDHADLERLGHRVTRCAEAERHRGGCQHFLHCGTPLFCSPVARRVNRGGTVTFHIHTETSTVEKDDFAGGSAIYAERACFSRNRWILPDSVFGSVSVKMTERGYL